MFLKVCSHHEYCRYDLDYSVLLTPPSQFKLQPIRTHTCWYACSCCSSSDALHCNAVVLPTQTSSPCPTACSSAHVAPSSTPECDESLCSVKAGYNPVRRLLDPLIAPSLPSKTRASRHLRLTDATPANLTKNLPSRATVDFGKITKSISWI